MIFSFGVYSETFSEYDKKEVLKQFLEFQKAVKKKDLYVFNHAGELKADTNTNKVINVEERALRKNGEFGDEYLSVTGEFQDADAEDGTVCVRIDKPYFLPGVNTHDEMFDGGTYHHFVLENKKLKMVSRCQLP